MCSVVGAPCDMLWMERSPFWALQSRGRGARCEADEHAGCASLLAVQWNSRLDAVPSFKYDCRHLKRRRTLPTCAHLHPHPCVKRRKEMKHSTRPSTAIVAVYQRCCKYAMRVQLQIYLRRSAAWAKKKPLCAACVTHALVAGYEC